MKNVSAQDDTNDIYNQPQNLVPNLDIKEEVIVQDNKSNIDEVVIMELPKANLGWVGYLSDKDGGLGLEMWEGTDSTFAKTILELF